MNLLRAILFAIGLASAAPSLAQATPESIANLAMEDLKKDDAKIAIENLIAKSPLVSVSAAEKTNLINTLNTLLTSYGAVDGWELIKARKASDRYVQHTYMVFQEKYALHWEMTFYRGADGWVLTSFKFNDTLATLLDAQWEKDLAKALEN